MVGLFRYVTMAMGMGAAIFLATGKMNLNELTGEQEAGVIAGAMVGFLHMLTLVIRKGVVSQALFTNFTQKGTVIMRYIVTDTVCFISRWHLFRYA